jgi:hypothetical protein
MRVIIVRNETIIYDSVTGKERPAILPQDKIHISPEIVFKQPNLPHPSFHIPLDKVCPHCGHKLDD